MNTTELSQYNKAKDYVNSKLVMANKEISPINRIEKALKLLDGYDVLLYDLTQRLTAENFASFLCEVEIDRSYIDTEANYMSVVFSVSMDDEQRLNILQATWYSDDEGYVYNFDPNSLELIK